MFQPSLDGMAGSTGLRSPALLAALRRVAASGLDNVHARLELLALELAEERTRLVAIVALAAAMAGTALLTLGFAGVLALAWAWNTDDRMWVAAAIPVAFLVVTAGVAFALRSLAHHPSPLFRHSLHELRRDVSALRIGE